MELENNNSNTERINELQKKIVDIEITLQVPGLTEEFIASSLEKIKDYRAELSNINF